MTSIRIMSTLSKTIRQEMAVSELAENVKLLRIPGLNAEKLD